MAKPKRSALARSVAAFNRRISRELARNPAASSYLPEKLKARELKAGIATAAERSRVIKELNRFQAPQMKKVVETASGFKATAWEVAAAKRYNQRANAARQQELAIRSLMPQNFKTRAGETQKMRLNPRVVDLTRYPDTALGRQAWNAFVKTERHMGSEKYATQKMKNYKEFYLARMQANLAGPGKKKALALVKSLPAQVIYAGQFNDPILTINNISPPMTEDEQNAEMNEMVLVHWQEMAAAMT